MSHRPPKQIPVWFCIAHFFTFGIRTHARVLRSTASPIRPWNRNSSGNCATDALYRFISWPWRGQLLLFAVSVQSLSTSLLFVQRSHALLVDFSRHQYFVSHAHSRFLKRRTYLDVRDPLTPCPCPQVSMAATALLSLLDPFEVRSCQCCCLKWSC